MRAAGGHTTGLLAAALLVSGCAGVTEFTGTASQQDVIQLRADVTQLQATVRQLRTPQVAAGPVGSPQHSADLERQLQALSSNVNRLNARVDELTNRVEALNRQIRSAAPPGRSGAAASPAPAIPPPTPLSSLPPAPSPLPPAPPIRPAAPIAVPPAAAGPVAPAPPPPPARTQTPIIIAPTPGTSPAASVPRSPAPVAVTPPPASPVIAATPSPPTARPSAAPPATPPSPPAPAFPTVPAAPAPTPAAPTAIIVPTPPATARPTTGAMQAQDLYQAAYIDFSKGNYPLAITGFKEFLRRHPDDELADNAQYWIGEAYLSLARGFGDGGQADKESQSLQQAVQEFRRVVADHPRGDKAPTALYKEALALIQLKQPQVAQSRLQYLVDNFPQAEETPLARERLAALKQR
jgi:TolA-binding protein